MSENNVENRRRQLDPSCHEYYRSRGYSEAAAHRAAANNSGGSMVLYNGGGGGSRYKVHYHGDPGTAGASRSQNSKTALVASNERQVALLPAPGWTLATDGSYDRHSGRYGAAAVLTAPDGSMRRVAVEGGSGLNSTAAELRALELGLKVVEENISKRNHKPLRVLVDSQKVIQEAQRGGENMRSTLEAVQRITTRRDVHAAFIHGHAGPREHDVADALARAAVRSHFNEQGSFGPQDFKKHLQRQLGW
jgi:ribonuclease HI